jgi:hypothetical protein
MVRQTRQDLPDPGDYRPERWRDVVGLLVALLGLALMVCTILMM